jgi:glycosyltransferase involved in cell wall biosynthesis
MASRMQTYAITWGGSQRALPLFMVYALLRAMGVAARGVDLVHIGDPLLMPIGCLVKSLYRLPVVVTVHGLDITFPVPLYQWTIPKMLQRCDRIVCISRHTRRACIERGIAAKKCVTIHPGINAPTAVPSRTRARQWLKDRLQQNLHDDVVLLTVGRLIARKGVAWFLNAVVPQVVCSGAKVQYVIVGSGPEEETIRAIIEHERMESVVHLLGQLSEADLSKAYAAADLFVMPNIKVRGDMEGFGLVALEAGAHGLPVLAADLEGIRDAIIPGVTGDLIATEDAEQWTRSVLALLAEPARLHAMATASRVTVLEHFGWKHMVDAYETLFRDMLRNPQGT